MRDLGTRTKLLFSLAIVLFCLFLFAESEWDQRFLTGQPPDEIQTHDEQPAGIGHPIVYFAIPTGVLLLLSLLSYNADKRRVMMQGVK